MQARKPLITLMLLGAALLFISALWLASARPVSAQCGSQASSCKDCHETQAQDPVNADGTGWHQSHAFGDFCYMCHSGNSQSPDKDTAHTGMMPPLDDIKGSCSSCHVKDFTEKAQVYASTLGVTLAVSAPAAAPTQAAPTAAAEAAPTQAAESGDSQVSAPAELKAMPVIDYINQYDESLAARQKTNWAGILLVIFAALLVLAGAFYWLARIGWLKVSFVETKAVQGEYPADVVDMIPDLARLKPAARKSLKHVIGNPAASDFLASLENLLGGGEKKEG